MRKPKAVIFAEELEGRDSPVLAVLKCNSLNSTLRTALARLHVSDTGDILPLARKRPRFARPIGGFERYGDVSPTITK